MPSVPRRSVLATLPIRPAIVPTANLAHTVRHPFRISSTHHFMSTPVFPLPPTATQSDGTKIAITSHNQYHSHGLERSDLKDNPIAQFQDWFNHALAHGVQEPEALALSTCPAFPGPPSTRIVLLKSVSPQGFTFYTNHLSRKGRELAQNPFASMAFYWREVHRQVRVVGRVEHVPREETAEYFRTRGVGSRIGAWASKQSEILYSREQLEERVKEAEARFGIAGDGAKDEDLDIPMPDFWGGYVLIPDEVEFWMGRPSRLHDRFVYRRRTDGDRWTVERLSP